MSSDLECKIRSGMSGDLSWRILRARLLRFHILKRETALTRTNLSRWCNVDLLIGYMTYPMRWTGVEVTKVRQSFLNEPMTSLLWSPMSRGVVYTPDLCGFPFSLASTLKRIWQAIILKEGQVRNYDLRNHLVCDWLCSTSLSSYLWDSLFTVQFLTCIFPPPSQSETTPHNIERQLRIIISSPIPVTICLRLTRLTPFLVPKTLPLIDDILQTQSQCVCTQDEHNRQYGKSVVSRIFHEIGVFYWE